MRRTAYSALFIAPLLFAACTAEPAGDHEPSPYDDEFPVSPWDPLLDGAPNNSDLPDENKADAVYPEQFTELLQWQSPVKSQGSRGVCSIFSSVALMEHLYIKAGMPNPDFSEQYLQWSAKFEVNSFPNTSGSNNYYNLEAIRRFGIVDEATYPYETYEWGPAQDPACTGDDRPTRCYTNGEPSEEVRNAQKWFLPENRYLSTYSIKAHMTSKKTGVVVGMTFFYQSWNHRLSDLPINNGYWRQGIVLYPNATDKQKSLEKRAGHAILLVGWDDNLEVPIVDENGDVVTDENGEPVKEKGFYIFKNSWGTGSFGVDNPHGDGYGFISMRYVHEYGSAQVSRVPDFQPPVEICGDGLDNDADGATDCDDSDCAAAAECQGEPELHTFTSDQSVSIPDNNATGITSTITVPDELAVGSLQVSVDISHTYRGDLKVTLLRGDTSVVLHDRTGGYEDDLVATFGVTDFDGTSAQGEWRLQVSDHAAYDTGTLNGWTLEILTN